MTFPFNFLVMIPSLAERLTCTIPYHAMPILILWYHSSTWFNTVWLFDNYPKQYKCQTIIIPINRMSYYNFQDVLLCESDNQLVYLRLSRYLPLTPLSDGRYRLEKKKKKVGRGGDLKGEGSTNLKVHHPINADSQESTVQYISIWI